LQYRRVAHVGEGIAQRCPGELETHGVADGGPQGIAGEWRRVRRGLRKRHTQILAAPMLAPFTRVGCDPGLNDDEVTAEVPHAFKQLEDVGRIEVIEEPQAENDVERAVPLWVECADVLQPYLQILEPERLLCQAHLLETCLSAFDGYDRGTLPSEFHGEETLERSQIEDAQFLDRPVREVCHELYHSPDTSLVPACYPSLNGVEIVLELQVVRDPSSVTALDLALPVFELVPIHRAPRPSMTE
jgi:hypothetical protein